MTWARIDDQLHAHPKVLHAWHAHRAAVGLHLLALSYSAHYLTDGFVAEAFVLTHLPTRAERRRTVDALLAAGLWEAAEGGWLIHDYLDFNEPRERVLGRRLARAGTEAPARGPAREARGRVPVPDPFAPFPFKGSRGSARAKDERQKDTHG